MGWFGKEEETEEVEEKEPDRECAFQEEWSESEEGKMCWSCALKTQNEVTCFKEICPFWREK